MAACKGVRQSFSSDGVLLHGQQQLEQATLHEDGSAQHEEERRREGEGERRREG